MNKHISNRQMYKYTHKSHTHIQKYACIIIVLSCICLYLPLLNPNCLTGSIFRCLCRGSRIQVALTLIAQQLKDEDLEQLRNTFLVLDKNKAQNAQRSDL